MLFVYKNGEAVAIQPKGDNGTMGQRDGNVLKKDKIVIIINYILYIL